MRLRIDGTVRTGRAVDCAALDVTPEEVVAAVRGGDGSVIDDGSVTDSGSVTGDGSVTGAERVAVDCPEPGPLHEHVGHVTGETTVRVRTALAAVARQRGVDAPQSDELAAVHEELASLDSPEPELAGARERLGSVDEAELSSLREDVAARRGAVQARLELGADVEPARDALSEAAAALADAQTDRVAAEQTLSRAREQAREARETRRERLRLQDRAGNLERAAREHLAGELRDAFAAAVDAVPGEGRVPGRPSSFEGDGATAALAVARLADLRAPVVLSCRRFRTASAAARCLDAPVVRL